MTKTVRQLRTARELALELSEALEGPIPPIAPDSGWLQPSRREIEVDDTHALMTPRTFDALHEYSGTMPTGVYPGKMWKRNDGVYDAAWLARGGKPEWLLMWYGHSEKGEGYCSINSRRIILADGEL